MPVLAEYLIADIFQADRADQEFVEALCLSTTVWPIWVALSAMESRSGPRRRRRWYRRCSRQILVQRIEMRIQLRENGIQVTESLADCAEGLVEFLGPNGRQHGHELLEELTSIITRSVPSTWPARIDPAMDSRAQRVESLWHLFEQNPRPDDRFQDLRGAPWSGRRASLHLRTDLHHARLSDLHIEFKPI